VMFNLSAGLFFPPKLAALHVRTLSAMGLCAPSPSTLLTPHGVSTSNSSRLLPLAPATTGTSPLEHKVVERQVSSLLGAFSHVDSVPVTRPGPGLRRCGYKFHSIEPVLLGRCASVHDPS
jgi:hypothetical protein